MTKNQLLLLLLLLSSTSSAAISETSAAQNQLSEISSISFESSPVVAQSMYLSDNEDEDSFVGSPLFIFLICLVAWNILIFIVIYGCMACLKLKFTVDLTRPRQTREKKYRHIRNFETKAHCLTEKEVFASQICFERQECITEVPAYILGKDFPLEDMPDNLLDGRQCSTCHIVTPSLEIFKYGKLTGCWEVCYMIMISPFFLALTIRTITSNNIIWRKIFCLECGREKGVQKQRLLIV